MRVYRPVCLCVCECVCICVYICIYINIYINKYIYIQVEHPLSKNLKSEFWNLLSTSMRPHMENFMLWNSVHKICWSTTQNYISVIYVKMHRPISHILGRVLLSSWVPYCLKSILKKSPGKPQLHLKEGSVSEYHIQIWVPSPRSLTLYMKTSPGLRNVWNIHWWSQAFQWGILNPWNTLMM